MNIFGKKDELLCPADREQVSLWRKRWGVTDEQLTEAIIETGSVHTRVLREYFVRSGALFSFFGFFRKYHGNQ